MSAVTMVRCSQKAKRALWFTDALLRNLPSSKPLLGGSEQRPTQTLPGDQLRTENRVHFAGLRVSLTGETSFTQNYSVGADQSNQDRDLFKCL